MPRLTDASRDSRRAQIVAAARRCFSRDGFHQTSMTDIAEAAGLSVGAAYRHFSGKEELVLQIAGDAFRVMFASLEDPATDLAGLVTASIEPIGAAVTTDGVQVDELLRCAVQAWAELLRNGALRERAQTGFEEVRTRMADALRQGQKTGRVPAELDPDRGARVVMALLHGFVLQRTAFGLTDTEGFADDVRIALGAVSLGGGVS